MIIEIDDADDERLGDYFHLTDVALRRSLEPERGLFMAESTTVMSRAIDAGHRPRSVLTAPRWLDDLAPILARADGTGGAGDGGAIPVYVAPEPLLHQIAGFRLHRGALAAMHRPELPALSDVIARAQTGTSGTQVVARPSRIAILENLVDHTNVGACFRSAAAMGLDAVLVTPSCADPLYRRAIRVSMGTVFQIPWTRMEAWPADIATLHERGYVVAGMTLGEGAITLDELVAEDHRHLALVFGTEGHGLTGRADRQLDRRVTIPMMHGVDSLNVAASSAVAFYATRPPQLRSA